MEQEQELWKETVTLDAFSLSIHLPTKLAILLFFISGHVCTFLLSIQGLKDS